jgi:pimeloyl-ACP methyl ester carboxylesterase
VFTIRSKRIRINGLNVRYFTGGRGEPLLVLHGGNSHGGPWAKNLRQLAHKYTVYVPDLPGFGLSEKMEGSYFIPELADFINEFCAALGLKSFYLMGHSMGGAIAASITLKHPEQVKKLILIDSMCMGKEIALWTRVLSSPPFAKSIGLAVINVMKGVRWAADAMFRSMEVIIPITEANLIIGSSAITPRSQRLVLLHRLSEILVPTLIIWGDRDKVLPVKQAYAVATVIPDCRLKVLSGGHCAYQERLPEFEETVREFLE